jgi:hypothetical protein
MFNMDHSESRRFKIIASIIIPLMGIIIPLFLWCYDKGILFNSTNEDKIIETLNLYSRSINTHSFDAAKVFSPQVEQFITMRNTTPEVINNYVNNEFYNEFIDPSLSFEFETLRLNSQSKNACQISVVLRETYFRKSKNRKETHRTVVRIGFDKKTKISLFNPYHVIYSSTK